MTTAQALRSRIEWASEVKVERNSRSTCTDCNRMIVIAKVGEVNLAFDPEILTVLPGTLHRTGNEGGISLRHGAQTVPARRLHSERCDTYREADRKARIAAEMRDFNKKQRAPRRNQGL